MSNTMTRHFSLVAASDGSAESRAALHVAFDLARAIGSSADVHVVSVVDYISLPAGLTDAPLGAPDLLASDAETELRVASQIAAESGLQITTQLLRGPVADEVLKYARAIDAALIVVGTHGRSGIARALMGSTCESLVRGSDIPVVTVRASAHLDNARPDETRSEALF